MALIKCKECGREISSSAINCPHCGAPINSEPTGTSKIAIILGAIIGLPILIYILINLFEYFTA